MPDLTRSAGVDGSTDSDLFEMWMGMTPDEWDVLGSTENGDEAQP
jgi:hypothetical protein